MELNTDLSGLSANTLALLKDVTTTGISSLTNLNFYQLEAKAKNLYPVLYPFLASTPRFDPGVGGTTVNWKGILAVDQNGTLGIEEGKRNAFINFLERDYSAPYSFLGKDGQVTFVAEQTGKGFDDNLSLNQLSLLNALLNGEERMLLSGNRSQVALGTTPTPTVALASGGTIPVSTSVTVACVALTSMAVMQAVTSTGILTTASRANADGSTTTVNYGNGAISALSGAVVTASGSQSVTATVSGYTAGAVGFAWYVSSADSLATAYFAGVTNAPSITITSLPSSANQAGNAPGLNTDNSKNATDLDGLLSIILGNTTNSFPSYFLDMKGAGFTPNGDSSIKEFESALDFFWTNYKTVPDVVWVGGTLINPISTAILQGSSSNARLFFDQNDAGKLTGATMAAAYRCKYSYNGQPKVLDIRVHPWLPQGVVIFDQIQNPYASAGNVIPVARRVNTLLDHFSIAWPITTLSYEVGTYCFETLQDYIPFSGGAIVNAGSTLA
jgi:hypothetical protein